MAEPSASPEQIAVVSHSECLWRRIRDALAPAGCLVEQTRTVRQFARHRRQRPFLLCFLDVRGEAPESELGECLRVRPAERYVLVVGPWQGVENGAAARANPFGVLREPFGPAEVAIWSRRAAEEARNLKGDQSFEDVLYARFRFLLQNLGSEPTNVLHDLVWERVERPLIRAVLEWAGGNQTRAAEILGIHRNTLRSKLRTVGIDPSQFGGR